VITSGHLPPNPSELIASSRMDSVIGFLADSADIVIYDSPPMAVVTDATLLGVKLDGVLLVVRLGITSRDAAKKTRELLTTSRAEVLGVVINDITRRHGHDYYYYYYYGDNENEHD
ncbi:MAG: hypothetical protein WBL71_05400, partial [Bacillota bacterium]